MKHLRLFAGLGVAAVLAGSVPVATGSAEEPTDPGAAKVAAAGAAVTDSPASLDWLPVDLDPSAPVKVIVTVAGPSVAEAEGAEAEAGTTFTAADEASVEATARSAQSRVASKIRSAGGQVQAQHVDAINAITAVVPAGQLDALADSSEVLAISPVRTYTRDNGTSDLYTGVPAAWEDYGFTGAGVKVAIIDDGIDYTHADFGGSGDPAAYATNDRETIEPGSFPTTKVVAGYDFVGDDYDASTPGLDTPAPDPDPLACGEHGTHVAGTTAGQGVAADGTTYTGPYDRSLDPADFLVAPGSAPDALLMAYKVFGCAGSVDNSVVVAAIDRAVADGADVINMSLGSTFGYADDPDAIAADNAVRAGVVVVVSAGNEGPMPYMVGGPSTGKRVISVAALDAGQSFPGALITGGPAEAPTTIEAVNANGAQTAGSLTAPLHVLGIDDTADPLGCAAADYAAVPVGAIVVTYRGTCARVDRAVLGQAAGASAVIMINTEPGFPPFEGEIPGVTIPFIGVRGTDAAALEALHATTVSVDPNGIIANPAYTLPADFTSGGPRSGDSGQKPDLIAPGVSVQSAFVGSGTGSVGLSGTSMAAPHVAGIAALVVQAHPDWSPTLVKAALVSTADPERVGGFDTRLAGNGLVDPAAAIATSIVLSGRQGEAAVNFGLEELSGGYLEVQTIKLSNLGGSTVTYDLSAVWNTAAAGASVQVWPSRVTVHPGRSRDVTVRISISKSAAAAFPAADAADGSLFTLQGQIVATPTAVSPSTPVVRVPFLMAPHSRSNVEVVSKRVSRTSTGKAGTLTVRNTGFVPGIADVYTWALGDGKNRHAKADSRAVGLQYFEDGAGDALIVMAFADHDRFASPAEQYQDVYIDATGDGAPDVELLVIDIGLLIDGVPTGDISTVVFDFASGDAVAVYGADGAPDGSVQFGYVYASDLGITETSGPATILAATTVALADGTDDPFDGTATIAPFAPMTSQGDYIPLASRASVNLPVWLRKPAAGEVAALGWMVVTVDDESGKAQADLINA